MSKKAQKLSKYYTKYKLLEEFLKKERKKDANIKPNTKGIK